MRMKISRKKILPFKKKLSIPLHNGNVRSQYQLLDEEKQSDCT